MSDPQIELSAVNPATELAGPAKQAAVHSDPLPRFWRSIGWLLVITLAYLLGALLFGVVLGAIEGFKAGLHGGTVDSAAINATVQATINSPTGLAQMYILQFAFIMPVIGWASSFPQQKAWHTLALKPIHIAQLWPWLLALIVYLGVQSILSNWVKFDDEKFMQMINGSKNLLLAFVLVVVAPIMEESIFRGYLYKAWRNTRLGFIGTLILTSVLFTLIHGVQYTWPLLAFLFVFSLLLGFAREKTGSIFTSIILHAVNNLVSVITVVYLGLAV